MSVFTKEDYNTIAGMIDLFLNGSGESRNIGFGLFIFKTGETSGGRVNYVSNCKREDMLIAVREWLARAEGRVQETETPQ